MFTYIFIFYFLVNLSQKLNCHYLWTNIIYTDLTFKKNVMNVYFFNLISSHNSIAANSKYC